MNPTQTRWTPLPPLAIDWQNGVPVARQSGDVFFSTEDGVAESDYVFIQGNQLRERWTAHVCDQPFVIAEVGLRRCLLCEGFMPIDSKSLFLE